MIQRIATQDRAIVGGALSILVLLAWAYTIRASVSMQFMGAEYMFAMWAVMMVAMMTPSAAPMVFAFSRVARARQGTENAPGAALAFLLGYLALWTGISVLATVAHTILARASLVSSMGVSTNRTLSALLLIAAGLYQFSPWKLGCLSKCRSPLGFLLTEWRDGLTGAFTMGLRHGLYCAGCCWLLMAALFVAGVMNLAWIAVLTLIALAERALPYGQRVSTLLGVAALLAGAWLLLRP
jgi:predicted metal-binding membrane protein